MLCGSHGEPQEEDQGWLGPSDLHHQGENSANSGTELGSRRFPGPTAAPGRLGQS